MFNLHKHKVAQISPYEKSLRTHKIDPDANDQQSIAEKELPHREGDKDTIVQDQMNSIRDDSNDIKVIEKVLNEAQSYVTHRSDQADTSVPPHNVLVEKNRQNRLSDYSVKQESHWSQTENEKKQFGSLPKWPKNVPQNDNIVLNNDPRRFETAENLPTSSIQSENDAKRNKSNTIKPLIGTITTADVHAVVENIKKGQSIDFDTAIVAILKEADKEERELTSIEQKTISDLKIARTKAMLQK